MYTIVGGCNPHQNTLERRRRADGDVLYRYPTIFSYDPAEVDQDGAADAFSAVVRSPSFALALAQSSFRGALKSP
jgi:hypothetical protein